MRIVLFVYGAINLIGGVIGFIAANSPASLIAGGLSGVLFIVLGVLAAKKPAMAFRSAGILTLIMLGFWIFRYAEVSQQGKSTMMPTMNIVLALAVLGLLAYGHFSAQKRRTQMTDAAGPPPDNSAGV